jgi:hypothetical protein
MLHLAGAYKHWGMYQPNNSPEPNNLDAPEDCVAGNFSEAFNGAWGWADVNCDLELPYICRVIRGCLWLVVHSCIQCTHVYSALMYTVLRALQQRGAAGDHAWPCASGSL